MNADELEFFIQCQVNWFVNTPRHRALVVWNNWLRRRSKEYMDDLRRRINEIKSETKSKR